MYSIEYFRKYGDQTGAIDSRGTCKSLAKGFVALLVLYYIVHNY